MKVLVTGGLGFIGSNFIRHMLSVHRDVGIVNLDKMGMGANQANLKDISGDERYTFIRGDIADPKLLKKIVREVDAIVNFAAETHVDRSVSNPWPFFRSNVEGVLAILEAVRGSKGEVKVIHVSTDEVYGDIAEGSFSEEDRPKPSSPYSASKAAADMLISAYHRTYGLNVSIVRPTNNFGPYQFPEKLIPKTVIRASMGLPIPLYGKGTNVRDWMYVADTCEAIDLILKKGESGEIYNVSAGNELSNLKIVREILKLLGKPETLITFVEDRPGHDLRYSLNSSKIRGLGWSPKHSFKEALKRTVEWYLGNEWWWRPLAMEQALHPTPWKLRW